MNIIVFIKQVPDTASRIKVAPDGRNIDESDVTWIISPYDEYALEEALRVKEKAGAGKVTVISMGPDRVATALRNALAMGADEAVHLNDAAFDGSDPYVTARILATAAQKRPFDLIFFGKVGVGLDQFQVPAMVAEILDLPQASQIAKLEVLGDKIRAHCEVEGATETMECALPCVLTAEKGLNEPRYPSLKGIMAAKKKPLEVLNLASLGLESTFAGAAGSTIEITSLALPEARQGGKILRGEPQETARELVNLLHTEAKVI